MHVCLTVFDTGLAILYEMASEQYGTDGTILCNLEHCFFYFRKVCCIISRDFFVFQIRWRWHFHLKKICPCRVHFVISSSSYTYNMYYILLLATHNGVTVSLLLYNIICCILSSLNLSAKMVYSVVCPYMQDGAQSASMFNLISVNCHKYFLIKDSLFSIHCDDLILKVCYSEFWIGPGQSAYCQKFCTYHPSSPER